MDNELATLLGLILLPAGVLSMAFAFVWQIHVMFAETGELDRFEGKELAKVVAVLFFTFSLAVYWYCPKSRKKGKWFWVALIGGAAMYVLSTQALLPPSKKSVAAAVPAPAAAPAQAVAAPQAGDAPKAP